MFFFVHFKCFFYINLSKQTLPIWIIKENDANSCKMSRQNYFSNYNFRQSVTSYSEVLLVKTNLKASFILFVCPMYFKQSTYLEAAICNYEIGEHESQRFLVFHLKKWYFVTKIVLTYCEKNCSNDQEKTFEIRGRSPRICKTFEVTTTIYSNSEMSVHFLKQNAF